MSTRNLPLEKVVELLSHYHPDAKQDLRLTLMNPDLFKFVGDIEGKTTYLFGCHSTHVSSCFYVAFVYVFKDITDKIVADYYYRPNRSFESLKQVRHYIHKHAKSTVDSE